MYIDIRTLENRKEIPHIYRQFLHFPLPLYLPYHFLRFFVSSMQIADDGGCYSVKPGPVMPNAVNYRKKSIFKKVRRKRDRGHQ